MLLGPHSCGKRTTFSSFSPSSPPPGLSSSATSCTRLGRQPCQAPGPVTGMCTDTGNPLWENPALANFSGHRPASAHWARDSPWPRLHQSPPPPSMSWHGKRLPGEGGARRRGSGGESGGEGEKERERGSRCFLKQAVQKTLQHPCRFPVGLLSSSLPVKTTQASRGRSALPQKGGLWGPPLPAAAAQQRDSPHFLQTLSRFPSRARTKLKSWYLERKTSAFSFFFDSRGRFFMVLRPQQKGRGAGLELGAFEATHGSTRSIWSPSQLHSPLSPASPLPAPAPRTLPAMHALGTEAARGSPWDPGTPCLPKPAAGHEGPGWDCQRRQAGAPLSAGPSARSPAPTLSYCRG